MKLQTFTASYHGDIRWMEFNLLSQKKFCRDMLPPVVCVSQADYAMFRELADRVYPEAQIHVLDGSGVSRAQVAMMSCDLMCPDADWIILLGSDCVVMSETNGTEYFHPNGKPVMLYNTYAHLLKHHPGVLPWKRGTERVLGFKVEREYMRRVPTLAHPKLYREMRAYVENLHGKPFAEYIVEAHKPHGDTSESNILGAYADKFLHDDFEWIDMDEKYQETVKAWPNPVLQFWSRGGIDRRCDQKFDYPGGNTFGKTPRQVITEILARPEAMPAPASIIETDQTFDTEIPMIQEHPRLVCALGVSHRDAGMAEDWLRWASFLASQPNGSQADSVLVVSGTKLITPAQWAALRAAVIKSPGMFSVQGHVLPDELERGYPQSASHLFVRTLEHINEAFPGSPILWVEPDTVPMRPGWFSEIEREYANCGKPFMGHLEGVTTVKHMTGVSVYPPNWKELAPKLEASIRAPDDPKMGAWKGAAFDIYAASETVPQMAQAKTIQQIWRPKPFTPESMSAIRPETALFHQCKDGKLIALLAALHHPEFSKHIKDGEGLFAVRGHHHKAVIGHEQFPVAARTMRLIGGWWSIIKPRSHAEMLKLQSLCVPGSLEQVTQAQLDIETAKARKKGNVRHV